MRHSDARAAGEMKFTLAPAGPSAGSDRSSLPRVTTSISSTSSTRTTRCGTPTVPSTACRSAGAVARPGTGAGARTGRVEVDHANDVRLRSGPDEHEPVCADAGAPRAHRPDVLDGPVGGRRVPAVDHDEVVARPRHLVDRGPD